MQAAMLAQGQRYLYGQGVRKNCDQAVNLMQVVLDVSFLGKGKDPGGHERAGFRATTTINRKDFGLTWNGG